MPSCDPSADSEIYCIRKGPEDGCRMICCDNENCTNGQWFHLQCTYETEYEKGP